MLVLAGGLIAVAATGDGFRWLTRELASLSQGALKLDGVEGHLLEPLSVRHLEFTTETTRLSIDQLRVEWRLRELLQRRLAIDRLSARRLVVETLKPSEEPVLPPPSLRLPWGLTLESLRIDLAELDIVRDASTLRFSDIRGGVAAAGDSWQLQLDSFVSPWATLRGHARIDQDAPFALTGHFDARSEQPMPVSAALDLGGALQTLAFRLEATAAGMRAHASGEAAPFADILLPHVRIVGEGIDPARLAQGAPTARLAFSGVFEELAGKRLLGTFSLVNSAAGKLDAGRLPLVELSGAVQGDTRQADFSALKIDLGDAGRLTGGGQWRAGKFGLDLSSERLNLAGLHSSLYPSRIRTSFQLSGDGSQQRLRVEASERYGSGQFVLTHDASKLVLESLDFSGRYGSRSLAQGTLSLDEKRSFVAKFDIARFNPAHFGKFPEARLNARGQATGQLAPAFAIQSRFELPSGELEGHPVAGKGRLNYAQDRLYDTEVDVNLAGNQIQLRGDYEKSKMQANWIIHAPALARLGRLGLKHLGLELAGQLDSTGSVSGNPAQPQIKLEAHAQGLRLPGGVAADRLDLRLDLQASASGAFNGELQGHGLALGERTVTSVRADVRGQRNAHTLALDAQLDDWRLEARAQGGLDAAQGWHGRLLAADIHGAWPLHLRAPAALQLGQAGQRIEAAEFDFAGGRVSLALLEQRDGRLLTQGRMADMPLAPVLTLAEQPLPISTDLLLAGEWDIRLADTLDGHVAIRRQSGDVATTDPAMKLGVSAATLDLRAVASRVVAQLEVNTREAGRIHVEGSSRLAREGDKLVLAYSEPVNWSVQAVMPDLRLLRPFLPLGTRVDARLALDLGGAGTLTAPVLSGSLDAHDIRVSVPEEGISIKDGTLRLALDANNVTVSEGVLHGQSGRILVQGAASWRNPAGGLELKFENFATLTRSDRQVWLSGTTRLGYADGRLNLEGDLRADKARIKMPETSRPRLSSDVEVVGAEAPAPVKPRSVHLDLNLGFDLGDDFLFEGAGLDARLGGKIRVFTRGDALQGEGSIKVTKGRYSAYGQTLDIQRGILTFSRAIENPSLDVLAVRKTGEVVAGVKVGGTVDRPLVTLYSDPAMPDTEKLSWLVFGHGLDNNDGDKFEMMQLMAGALLSKAESVNLQRKLADALALDSFEVRGDDDDVASTIVSVGKRINAKLSMNYEQSLDGLEQLVKAVYQFSPSFRVEAATGTESSLDVFYMLEFD